MFDKTYRIDGASGMAPADGVTLMLRCSENDGLLLQEARGFARKTVQRIEPTDAHVVKTGPGRYSELNRRHLGSWDVWVVHREGVTTLHMKGKDDARRLAKWIDEYAARKGGI